MYVIPTYAHTKMYSYEILQNVLYIKMNNYTKLIFLFKKFVILKIWTIAFKTWIYLNNQSQ